MDFVDNDNEWKERALKANKDIKKYDAKIYSKIYRDTIIPQQNQKCKYY